MQVIGQTREKLVDLRFFQGNPYEDHFSPSKGSFFFLNKNFGFHYFKILLPSLQWSLVSLTKDLGFLHVDHWFSLWKSPYFKNLTWTIWLFSWIFTILDLGLAEEGCMFSMRKHLASARSWCCYFLQKERYTSSGKAMKGLLTSRGKVCPWTQFDEVNPWSKWEVRGLKLVYIDNQAFNFSK